MCDEAEPGLCAAGSFIFGTFVGTLGGWVSTLFFDGSWAPVPGLACGSTFGILAAAFPNGPPARVAAAVLVAASPVAMCCRRNVRRRRLRGLSELSQIAIRISLSH